MIPSPHSMSLFVADPVLFRNVIKQRVGVFFGIELLHSIDSRDFENSACSIYGNNAKDMLLRKLIPDFNATHLRKNSDSPGSFPASPPTPHPQMVKNIYILMIGARCRRFGPATGKSPKGSGEPGQSQKIQLCFALGFLCHRGTNSSPATPVPKAFLEVGNQKGPGLFLQLFLAQLA